MDEFKMDGLELPETGETYDDLPDASEGLEETAPEAPRPSDSMDNFDDIAMPVLSEMDGSEVTAPADKQEEKAVSLDKPSEPKPMFEDMSAPARPQNTQQSSSSGRSTYQSTSSSYQSTSGSYQSSYQSTSGRTTSSMDDLYTARMAVDPEKYEKGKKKTKVVAGVGIALYGYNTLYYLLSLIGGGKLTVLLDLGISGFLLYMFIRFFIGSNTAKESLAWWIGIDVVFNIIGLFSAGILTVGLSGVGLGIIGVIAIVMGFITLVARCVMLYFLVLDDDISEYSKNKQ
ncbi:MAG: hypothetical protein ACI4J0_04280 [Huintestinicola sp.]|uniref:hypothetical protein n=1 Tax=Huintestinicola sp. TaxID=2981661 RepID=UPI003EFFFF75